MLIGIKMVRTKAIDKNQNELQTSVAKCHSLFLVPLLLCDNPLRPICKNGVFVQMAFFQKMKSGNLGEPDIS